jgi:hypothetical protein
MLWTCREQDHLNFLLSKTVVLVTSFLLISYYTWHGPPVFSPLIWFLMVSTYLTEVKPFINFMGIHNTSITKNNDKNTAYYVDFALRMEQKTLKLQILFLLFTKQCDIFNFYFTKEMIFYCFLYIACNPSLLRPLLTG